MGTLEVKLIQAHGLVNKDILGKSDPYAKLYTRHLHSMMQTSKVIDNHLNPVWNEHFQFVVDDTSTQHLTVEIYDDDVLKASEFIGRAHIKLSELEPGKLKDVWLKLVKDFEIERENEHRGKVHLELFYCPDGVGNEFTNPFSSNFLLTSLENDSGAENSDVIENKRSVVITRGVLSVTVISAEDLPPADLMGKADPFVVLTMKKTGTKNKTSVTTIELNNLSVRGVENLVKNDFIINEDLNPVWNETFDFVVEEGLHDLLVAEVWDHDTFGKDYMGRCILTLTRVILEGEYEDSFEVEGAKSGKLNLNFKWLAKPIDDSS